MHAERLLLEYARTKFGVDISGLLECGHTQRDTQTHTQSQTPLITLSDASITPALGNYLHSVTCSHAATFV